MMATEVLPYVVSCNLTHEIKRCVDSLLEGVVENIRSLPSAVTSCNLDQCQVYGAVPITRPQIEVLLRRVTDKLLGRIHA